MAEIEVGERDILVTLNGAGGVGKTTLLHRIKALGLTTVPVAPEDETIHYGESFMERMIIRDPKSAYRPSGNLDH